MHDDETRHDGKLTTETKLWCALALPGHSPFIPLLCAPNPCLTFPGMEGIPGPSLLIGPGLSYSIFSSLFGWDTVESGT